ncbi:MAG: SpoIIE family protein phosphatase [Leptospiraceae bacterium]|nr:SpoIIE family protein phosphatase [Leptospiraceae bacterium]
MNLTLRNKLILGFIGLDIGISLLLSAFLYRFSYEMFLDNFLNHKISIAKFISTTIEGEELEKLNSAKDLTNSIFEKYKRFLEKIYQNETSVKYIYTLNYNPDNENLYYAIDTNRTYKTLSKDNIWIKSDFFTYNLFVNDSKELIANYNNQLQKGKFEFHFEGSLIKNEVIREANYYYLKINDKIVLKISYDNQLSAEFENAILDKNHRSIVSSISVNNKNYPLNITFNPVDQINSEFGILFTENTKSKLTNMIRNRISVDVSIDRNSFSYEDSMEIYSTIFNTEGKGIGIVILNVNTEEIDDFRIQMMTVAIIISIFTFLVTTIAAFFLARYFTRPLEILSAAVDNLASGKLIMIENVGKKDEFGNLAKSFNVMVENLKIASEVQYNLIIEISNFNESLEKNVAERTRTIRDQSQELEKQIKIAKKIQISLLPEDVPQINGANLSFRYQPMMGVGGDFIDFEYKNNDDILLFICDVSGHGVPAAFLATMVKMSLQDCYEMNLSPLEALNKIHRSLQGKLSGHFLSAIYCHINLRDGVMTSANAGHLPILKVGLEGEYEFINSRGRIICEAFPTNSEEVKTKLKIGDKIILYTDGITEARNKEQMLFGETRLIEISSLHHLDSSSDLCNKIYDSVLNFTGNSQSQFTDDITILVAEFSGRDNMTVSNGNL